MDDPISIVKNVFKSFFLPKMTMTVYDNVVSCLVLLVELHLLYSKFVLLFSFHFYNNKVTSFNWLNGRSMLKVMIVLAFIVCEWWSVKANELVVYYVSLRVR